MRVIALALLLFFFNDTATTEIYTLSLHDALPISEPVLTLQFFFDNSLDHVEKLLCDEAFEFAEGLLFKNGDRKSTRLNSSHGYISYAVFCLKKKKTEAASPPRRRLLHPSW